ncbi:MAG: ATPase P, partial [Clostridia bacterium]|nr:ATPase P [Clostridia bacterium]
MEYYNKDVNSVIETLQTDEIAGLTTAEVASRQAVYGANMLKGKKKKGMFLKF